ncbi:MAG TPA: (Fe-S)-binding protein [Thermodesulfobacteriota bacterium]|nr:(Fe-S)-binding protein [Thermodesulfobacteriota bacterium]
MLNFKEVLSRFNEECTGCGLCLQGCPMIPFTDLGAVPPERIMEEIRNLLSHRKVGYLALSRINTCLYCNNCASSCPQGLNPALAFALGKGVLQELGEPVKPGASVLTVIEKILQAALPAFREKADGAAWLITDIQDKPPTPCETLLFPSCFALIQQEVLLTAVRILQKIDPGLRVLGGFDYCCGELQLMAGQPEAAEEQFVRLIEGLNAFKPKTVVIFCPTCKMNFDKHYPRTDWSWIFITDFIFDHLARLGPLKEVPTEVTIHDPCHFVRGKESGSDSPRKILRAIPGLSILEMKNRGEGTWCCGAYAINSPSGKSFRDARLVEAAKTGASVLSLYCPGCQMILGPEGPKYSLQVESVLSLLGQSMGL